MRKLEGFTEPTELLDKLDDSSFMYQEYLKLWEFALTLMDRLRHSEAERFKEEKEYHIRRTENDTI